MGIRVPPALIGEMKKADLMVALGERMTDTVSQSYSFPKAPQPQLPFVHVWPDANEVGRVWRPDLGIPASPHEVIKALLKRGAPPDAKKRRDWVAGLNAIPGISCLLPEGAFYAFPNVTSITEDDRALAKFLLEEGGVARAGEEAEVLGVALARDR